MPNWEVRLTIHAPAGHREHVWEGEAEDRAQARWRALRDAEAKNDTITATVPVTAHIATA
jgi:hypothetical protein